MGGEEEPAKASEKEQPVIQKELKGHGVLEAKKRKFTEERHQCIHCWEALKVNVMRGSEILFQVRCENEGWHKSVEALEGQNNKMTIKQRRVNRLAMFGVTVSEHSEPN